MIRWLLRHLSTRRINVDPLRYEKSGGYPSRGEPLTVLPKVPSGPGPGARHHDPPR